MNRKKRHSTGTASDYIVHFKKLAIQNRILKVILYLRVSRCQQRKNGNLADQERYLKRIIRYYEKKYHIKIEIVAVIKETASGWSYDKIELEKATIVADEYDAIVVLAESSDRFVRSRFYHSHKNPDVLPNVREYEALKRESGGVVLATIVSPNKSSKSYQTKRGMHSKNKLGGRPCKKYAGYKKETRDKWRPVAQRLHSTYGSVAKVQRILEQKTGK